MSDKIAADITTIMVSYNTESLLPKAINTLRDAATGFRLKIVIIDNVSRDGSVSLIRRDFPDCILIENKKNVGFGRANNQALSLIEGRYVLLLNTDAFVSPDTLEKTIAYMDKNRKCGVLGVKLVGREGDLQPSCRYFPTPLNLFLQRTGLNRLFPGTRLVDDMSWNHDLARECDWVPGCYFLLRKEVIEEIGLFDERYFLYCEEVDLCFSAKKAGWQVHYYPGTTVIHLGGESAKTDNQITDSGLQVEKFQIESELLYFRKNYGLNAVILHVMLNMITDFISPIKRLLKRSRPVGWRECWRHVLLYWSLCWKTKLGSNPTR